MLRLAALLTCHNRRRQTIECLAALLGCVRPDEMKLDVFVVDDGSTDGTAAAIRTRFTDVQVMQGDGNLYWAGGMRLAFAEALKRDYDFYLFLNDDTVLESDALMRLLATHEEVGGRSKRVGAIIGTTRDPETRLPTYGGATACQLLALYEAGASHAYRTRDRVRQHEHQLCSCAPGGGASRRDL